MTPDRQLLKDSLILLAFVVLSLCALCTDRGETATLSPELQALKDCADQVNALSPRQRSWLVHGNKRDTRNVSYALGRWYCTKKTPEIRAREINDAHNINPEWFSD